MNPDLGVDARGFILCMPQAPVAAAFVPLLDDLCTTLAAGAGPLLDGIYLYGSVARGTAVPGRSDLDLSLVLRRPASAAHRQLLDGLRMQLQARHEVVTKIDFDLGSRDEVLAPSERLRWGYWLKHHCRCIWGEDLSRHFARLRPSRAIAWAVNGDFEPVLLAYADQIDAQAGSTALRRLQREAARKLIRSTAIVRPESGGGWPLSLADHLAQLQCMRPALAGELAWFLPQAEAPSAGAPEFSARLRALVARLAALGPDLAAACDAQPKNW